MVANQPTKFGGHRLCSDEGIIFLVCHVISEDRVTQGRRDSTDRSLHPTRFGAHRLCRCVDIFLVCRMTWQDHVKKESCHLMRVNLSWLVITFITVVLVT